MRTKDQGKDWWDGPTVKIEATGDLAWDEDKLRGKHMKDGLSLRHVASGKSLPNLSFWEICGDHSKYNGLWVGHATSGPGLPEDHYCCPQHPHCGEFSLHHI